MAALRAISMRLVITTTLGSQAFKGSPPAPGTLQNYFTQPGYQTNRGSSSLRRYSHAASVIFFRSYIGRQPSRNLAFALSSQLEWYRVDTGTEGKPRDFARYAASSP